MSSKPQQPMIEDRTEQDYFSWGCTVGFSAAWLEWYVEDFLELSNRVSWHEAAIGACFQLGLDDEAIRCNLPACGIFFLFFFDRAD